MTEWQGTRQASLQTCAPCWWPWDECERSVASPVNQHWGRGGRQGSRSTVAPLLPGVSEGKRSWWVAECRPPVSPAPWLTLCFPPWGQQCQSRGLVSHPTGREPACDRHFPTVPTRCQHRAVESGLHLCRGQWEWNTPPPPTFCLAPREGGLIKGRKRDPGAPPVVSKCSEFSKNTSLYVVKSKQKSQTLNEKRKSVDTTTELTQMRETVTDIILAMILNPCEDQQCKFLGQMGKEIN